MNSTIEHDNVESSLSLQDFTHFSEGLPLPESIESQEDMPMVKTHPSPSHVIVQASRPFDITANLVPENDKTMKHASTHPRVMTFELPNPDKEDLLEELVLDIQPAIYIQYWNIIYDWVMEKYDYWKPIE
jgi:hypothetical protein